MRHSDSLPILRMEGVFKKNMDDHIDSLVWQYIGTPQGVMRTFPAMSLYPLTRTGFDVRKRPWYNAGRWLITNQVAY